MDPSPIKPLGIETVPNSDSGITVLKLTGPLTIHNFYDFQEMTRKEPFPRVLVVDVSGVPYIDSAAMGSFVGLHVACQAGDRKYALTGANERLKNLFDLTQVLDFLVTYDTVDEAIARLG